MRLVKLGEVCTFKPSKGLAKVALSEENEVSFGPMEQLNVSSKWFEPQPVKRLKEVYSGYVYFAENDLIYAKITPCFENGKMGIARNLKNGVGFGSSEFVPIRCSNAILPEYLYYFLLQPSFIHEGSKIMTGTSGHRRLPNEFTENLEIYLPTIDEQQRIVKILDATFEKIDDAAKLIEINQMNAREIFLAELEKLFKKGQIWDKKLLSQVGVIERGKSKHRPRNDPSLYGGDYPFVQTGDIRNSKRVITDFRQTYNEKGLAQSKLWPKGTLCITIAANIAETAVLGFDACFPDSIIGFIPNEGNVKFYEYLITHYKDVLQAKSKGSAQDNINLGTFQSTPLPIPGSKEQNEIVIKLDAADYTSQKLRALYQRKLSALANLKQSLLNKAFKGAL